MARVPAAEIVAHTMVRVVVLVSCIAALAGCGSSNSAPTRTVDDAAVESGIKQQLSSPSAEVTSVKCPSDQESKPGGSFTCSVSWSNGATGKVKVTQTAGNHFTYEPVSGSVQVPGSTVEKSLEQDLAKQGAPNATVHCPDNIIVKVGTTVTCDLGTASGKTAGSLTFQFSSATGTIDTSSVKTT